MEIVKIIGVGLVALILIIILKQYKPEFTIYASIIAGAIILLMVMDKQGIEIPDFSECTLYIATMGESAKEKAFELAMTLRQSSMTVETDVVGRGFRAQMKYADKIGAKYSMVLGDNELEQKKAVVKNMNTGKQTTVRLGEDFLEDFVEMMCTDEDEPMVAYMVKANGEEKHFGPKNNE